ncbi:hypothetical protein [Gorillibacterium sp. sgz500922]|uniref:hypothetical protein n=1 Tax=Gorillibacterium sp. sgz500922 TaxID=3446694 RepID=UPI003F667F90
MKAMDLRRHAVQLWLKRLPQSAGAVYYEAGQQADGERRLLVLFMNEEGSSRSLHVPEEEWQLIQLPVTLDRLRRAPFRYEERDLVHWLRHGEVLRDPEGQLQALRDELDECSEALQGKLILTEFCRFYRHYLKSKRELEDNCLLDSYEDLLQAIHHWGRLSVVEAGMYPERMIWEQVRAVNIGVFKLYEELTSSSESLLKRIQLVLLASDFCVVSKLSNCCSYLFQILEGREEPWSLQELENELGGAGLSAELSVLLAQLEKKAQIREVFIPFDEQLTVMERRFFRSLGANRREAVKP